MVDVWLISKLRRAVVSRLISFMFAQHSLLEDWALQLTTAGVPNLEDFPGCTSASVTDLELQN